MEIPIKPEYQERFEEFKQLDSVEDQLHFWNDRLPVNYIQYHELGNNSDGPDYFTDLGAFRDEILKGDWLEINQWILKNYLRLTNKAKKETVLLDYSEMVDAFNFKLSKIKSESDRLDIIKEEAWNIINSFQPEMPVERESALSRFAMRGYRNNRFHAEYKIFIKYVSTKGLMPDYSKVSPSPYYTIKVANAVTLGKYVLYLNGLEKELEQSEHAESIGAEKKGGKRDAKLTEARLVLIAHHLGMLDALHYLSIPEKVKGEVLGDLLSIGGENAEKYRRMAMQKHQKIRTEHNYIFLVEYFEDRGLTIQMNDCKAILKEIRTK